MYCAENTYFCLVRACISSFVRVTFSPVCLSVNMCGFVPCARISLFVRMPFSPVCLSINLRGFVPSLSVRVHLYPVFKNLPLCPNTLLQWYDDYQSRRAIILVSSKTATAAWVFLVAFGNALWSTSISLTIAPAFASTDASSAEKLSAHYCDGSSSGLVLSLSISSS